MIGALIARKKLADLFGALNRRDLNTFMAAWHDNGTFVYPGEIPASGTFSGRRMVEAWFAAFFEQFPEIQFEVRDLCVRNLFDLVGTNVLTVHWDIRLKNRHGRVGTNSGVTLVRIERGKAVFAKDFIFDLGENFRLNWSAGGESRQMPAAQASEPVSVP